MKKVLYLFLLNLLINISFATQFWFPDTYSTRFIINELWHKQLISQNTLMLPININQLINELSAIKTQTLDAKTQKRIKELLSYTSSLQSQSSSMSYSYKHQSAKKTLIYSTPTNHNLDLSTYLSYKSLFANLNIHSNSTNTNFNNSYAGFRIKNYLVSAGAHNMYWGPGWNGSLILSNNSDPIPGLTIYKIKKTAFKQRFLNKLGPWDMRAILGQLEKNRPTSSPFFHAMRVELNPRKDLSIGLSRAAMFGGGNRKANAKLFLNMFFGNDNFHGEGHPNSQGLTEKTEPGNQLAGYDFKWRFKLNKYDHALYGQSIGEDYKGYFPTKHLTLIGIEGYMNKNHYFVEYTRTFVSDVFAYLFQVGTAYEHHIYPNGYTYKNEIIGHYNGADSVSLTLGLIKNKSLNEETRFIVEWIDHSVFFTKRYVSSYNKSIYLTLGKSFKYNKTAIHLDLVSKFGWETDNYEQVKAELLPTVKIIKRF